MKTLGFSFAQICQCQRKAYGCFLPKYPGHCPVLCCTFSEGRGGAAGGSISAEDKNRINKMIKKAGSVIGLIPATLEATVEMRARSKLKLILGYKNHPLHNVFKGLGSSFSERLAMPQCSTELRKFFVPAAVRNFNKHC